MSISKEAWYKIAGERELAYLLKAYQKEGTLETATALWRAYLRLGKLPPLEYEWLEELEAAGETMPTFEVQESVLHYVMSPEEDMWVPWEYGEAKKRPQQLQVDEIVRVLKFWESTPHKMDSEMYFDAYTGSPEEGGTKIEPFFKLSFDPQPTSGGLYDETQEDNLLYLRMSEENAKQVWRWVQE